MNAVISGTAGVALVVDGERLFSIDIDRLDDLVPCRPDDVRSHFGDAQDQWFMEGAGLNAIKQALDESWRAAEALELALILLDEELSCEARVLAAHELETALRAPETAKRLKAVLYAKALPESAGLQAATGFCQQVGALVREGAFRDLVVARMAKPSTVRARTVELRQCAGVRAIPGYPAILAAWTEPLAPDDNRPWPVAAIALTLIIIILVAVLAPLAYQSIMAMAGLGRRPTALIFIVGLTAAAIGAVGIGIGILWFLSWLWGVAARIADTSAREARDDRHAHRHGR